MSDSRDLTKKSANGAVHVYIRTRTHAYHALVHEIEGFSGGPFLVQLQTAGTPRGSFPARASFLRIPPDSHSLRTPDPLSKRNFDFWKE